MSRVWPEPPDEPRIAFVSAATRPSDLGVSTSGFRRLGNWLTGSEKGNEPFIKPFAVAFDEQDNLCLVDSGANQVAFFERAGRKWRHWDQVGNLRFSVPVAVARRDGKFYVADPGLASVVIFDDTGRLLRQVTNAFERPVALAMVEKRLFVADSQRHRIVVLDLDGNIQGEFGQRGTGPGQLNYPTHLATDSDGNLLVTDSMNCRVQRLDPSGKCLGEIGKIGDSPGHLGRPKGVAVDSAGRVYAVDAMFDSLQIFDPKGRLLLSIGETGANPGQFWLPAGIAINRSNEIVVADSYNRRLQFFKYVGP